MAKNPTAGLKLPKVDNSRDRIADPVEAAALLAAVPDCHRAIWATAIYAGLRLGELRALRWEDVDLAAGLIRVRRSWDTKERVIEPKTAAGTRSVPIAALLRSALVAHRLASLCTGDDDLVLGHGLRPFFARTVTDRAESAWTTARLQQIPPHECRHTYASLMIAANVNAKAPSTYMGHASVTITFDRRQGVTFQPALTQETKHMLPSCCARLAARWLTRSSAQDDRLVIARAQHPKVPGASR